MFSYALATASTYFSLTVDEDEDKEIASYERKYLTWVAEPLDSPSTGSISSSFSSLAPSSSSSSSSPSSYQSSSSPSSSSSRPVQEDARQSEILAHILSTDDLYEILGVSKDDVNLEKVRRAYLSRSRACHPDKFPKNPNATFAFQKVAVAYDVLSKPSSKRLYDSRSPSSGFDYFSARPANHADETLRSVVLGVFNDFLEGDMEIIRNLLKTINDLNPALRVGDDGIESVLKTLQAIRERALTCRTCLYALHTHLSRLLEVQHAFRQLSYFDLRGRSHLTIQLTRITLGLPLALEKALIAEQLKYSDEQSRKGPRQNRIFPQRLTLLIHAIDVVLERMEKFTSI